MTTHNVEHVVALDSKGLKKVEDGWAVEARVAKAGNVQPYYGSEFGIKDKGLIRVYRPADAVFDRESVESYARKPVTVGHPGEVTNDNWKEHAVGEIDSTVVRDGEFIKVPLLIRDSAAAQLIESGQSRELSMGYKMNLTFDSGISPEGEEYDAIATNLRMNHVALVPTARGGPELRVGDAAPVNWGARPVTVNDEGKTSMTTPTLKSIVVGDQAFQVNDEAFTAINLLKDQIKVAATDHAAAIAAKDTEIGGLQVQLKTAQDAAITPEKLAKAVADRVALETTVKALDSKIEMAGKTDIALRREAVAAKHGAEFIASASDAMVEGMFAVLAKDAKTTDPMKTAFQPTPNGANPTNVVTIGDASSEYEKMRQRDAAAWKGKN